MRGLPVAFYWSMIFSFSRLLGSNRFSPLAASMVAGADLPRDKVPDFASLHPGYDLWRPLLRRAGIASAAATPVR